MGLLCTTQGSPHENEPSSFAKHCAPPGQSARQLQSRDWPAHVDGHGVQVPSVIVKTEGSGAGGSPPLGPPKLLKQTSSVEHVAGLLVGPHGVVSPQSQTTVSTFEMHVHTPTASDTSPSEKVQRDPVPSAMHELPFGMAGGDSHDGTTSRSAVAPSMAIAAPSCSASPASSAMILDPAHSISQSLQCPSAPHVHG